MSFVEIAEAASQTGVSEAYLRRLCRENKVNFKREPISKGSTRMKYLIDLDSEELDKYFVSEPSREGISAEVQEIDKKNVNSDYVTKLIEELSSTNKKLVEYAQEVGKTKLLTDSLIDKEKDKEHWQNEYFKIKHENEFLKNRVLEQTKEAKWKFWK